MKNNFSRKLLATILSVAMMLNSSAVAFAADEGANGAGNAIGTSSVGSENVTDSGTPPAPPQVLISDIVALINDLRDLDSTNKDAVLEKQDAIQALKDAYAALSTADRVAFNEIAEKTRYDELIEALAGFLRENRPGLTSDDVGATLDALTDVNLSDRVELLAAKDKLTAALKAYEKLAEGEKRLFTEAQAAFVQKLSDALKAYYEKPATASEIAELMSRLATAADAGEAPDAYAVRAARAAYDALSEEEKAAFDADTLALLVMLEEALAAVPMAGEPITIEVSDGSTTKTGGGADLAKAVTASGVAAANITKLTITKGEMTAEDWKALKTALPKLETFVVSDTVQVADIPGSEKEAPIFPKSIKNVTIPQVITVGNHTFFGCADLTEVNLPKAATIDSYAFFNCKSLSRVSLPAATTVNKGAFGQCDLLATLELPKVTHIGSMAFMHCQQLATLKLGTKVPNVDADAFGGCIAKDKLVLVDADGNELTDPTALATAIAEYDKVVDYIVGSTATDGLWYGWKVREPVADPVASWAVTGGGTGKGTLTEALAAVKASGGTITLLDDVEDTHNPLMVTISGFSKPVTLVLNGKTLGADVTFESLARLFTVDGTAAGSKIRGTTGSAIFSDGTNLKLKGGTYIGASEDGETAPAIAMTVAASDTKEKLKNLLADSYAFESETGFTVISIDGQSAAIIGNTVKVVPTDNITITVAMGTEIRANVGSTNLTNAVLKSELPQTEITELTITAGKVTIDDWAYLANNVNAKLRSLTDFTISASIPDSNVADIPDVRQYNEGFSSTLKNVTIPQKIQIGKEVFLDCRNLTQVNIPKATKIGESAFSRCRALEAVSFPEVTAISENAFSGCSKLAAANFPKATTIGNYAFSGCSELASLTLGKEPPQVAAFTTFSSCPDLRTLTITGVTGDALAAAQAAYKAVADGNVNDDLWYGWKIGSAATTVPVTGVILHTSTLSLEAGKTVQLYTIVQPTTATNKEITWTTSNPAVATVDENGNVTAVAVGSSTITVTTTDGGKTATCAVTATAVVTKPAPGGKLEAPLTQDKVDGVFGEGNATLDNTATPLKITIGNSITPEKPIEIEANVDIDLGGNTITGAPGQPPLIIGDGSHVNIGGGGTVSGGDNPGGAGGNGITGGADSDITIGGGTTVEGGDGGAGGDGIQSGGNVTVDGSVSGGNGSSGNGGSGVDTSGGSGNITVKPDGSATGGNSSGGNGNGGNGTSSGGNTVIGGDATGGNGNGSGSGGNGAIDTAGGSGSITVQPGGSASGGSGGTSGGNGGDGVNNAGGGSVIVDGNATGGAGGSGATGGTGGNGTSTDGGATVINPGGNTIGGSGGSASSGSGGAGGSGSTSTGGGSIEVGGDTTGGSGGSGATGGTGGNGTSTDGATVIKPDGSTSGGSGGNGSSGSGGSGGSGSTSAGGNISVGGDAAGGAGGSGATGGNGGNGTSTGGGTVVNGGGSASGGTGGNGSIAGGDGGNGTNTPNTNTSINGDATGGNGGGGKPGTNGNGGNGGNGANQGSGLVNGTGTATGGNGGSGAGTGSGGNGGMGVGGGAIKGDNLTTKNGISAKVEVVGDAKTEVKLPDPAKTVNAVMTDVEKADPDITDVKVTLKVDDKTADKPADAGKAEAVKPANSVIGAFFDITLQKTITKNNNVVGSPETVTNVPNGVVTITIEIPSTMRGGSDYVIIRVHNETGEALTTTQSGNELTFESSQFSTYAIAYTKSVTPPSDHTSGGGSGSSDNIDYNFWMTVKEKIQKADSGDVIKVNARGYDKMPASVMNALRKNDGVSLVITWSGKTITIPAGKAAEQESGRIYWPLSKLAELYADIPEDTVLKPAEGANPETGKLIPVAGGGALITLEAPSPIIENTLPNGTENTLPNSMENTQEIAPTQPKAITPPDAGFEQDAFAGTEDAKQANSGSTFAVIALMLAAVAVGSGVWFWKKRREVQ